MLDIRDTSRRCDEERERNFVPLHGARSIQVDSSPTAQPLTLEDSNLGLVGSILASQNALEVNGVANGELRTVLVDGPTVLLRIDVGLARTELHGSIPLRSAHSEVLRAIVDMDEVQVANRPVALSHDVGGEVQSVVRLPNEAKSLLVLLVEHSHRLGLEVDKKVVLAVLQELVGNGGDIVGTLEDYHSLRELEVGVLLLVEAIGNLSAIVVATRLEAVRVVPLHEEVLVEGSRRLTADTQTESVVEVVREGTDDGTYVELAGLARSGSLDEVLEERLDDKQRDAHVLRLRHGSHEVTQATLLLREFYSSVLVPELLVLVARVGHSFHLALSLEQILVERVETIVTESRIADHQNALAEQGHLGPHIVVRQRPFLIRKLAVNLIDVERADEIDVALLGNGEVALLDVKGGVLQNVDVAVEADILRVVGRERQMIARIAVH